MILFIILFSISSYSFTDQELQKRKNTVSEIASLERSVMEKYGPCAGMQLFSEAVFKNKPTKNCEKSQKIYDVVKNIDKKYRDNCHDLLDFFEKTLKNPNTCGPKKTHEDTQNQLSKKLAKLKATIMDQTENEEDVFEKLLEDPNLAQLDDDAGKGEFSKMECALPVTISTQYKIIAKRNLSTHYSIIDTAIGKFCELSSKERNEYLRYIKEGEQAF